MLFRSQLSLLIHKEHAVLVGVQGLRNPVIAECLPGYLKVAEQALVFTHVESGNLTCGVVNKAVQTEVLRSAKPWIGSGIDLQHHAQGGLPWPARV